jgi:hypothetical protein
MRRHILAASALSLVLMLSLPTTSFAQQATGHSQVYWTMSSYQVDWPKVDSLRKLVEAYTLPIVAEAKKGGTLLDYRFLIHSWAGRDNVVIMRAFNTFDAINSDSSFDVAFRRLNPDSTKRKMINDAFGAILGGGLHHDEIFTEVTKP